MKHKISQRYILRYYLPIVPNYDKTYTEKRFLELLEFCKINHVEAVMFYVALDRDFYYMPESIEYAKTWQKEMLPYIKRLRENGIGYQLNFQNLMGATTNGADFKDRYDWEYMVDHKGVQIANGCPLGQKFRKQAGERLKIWAQTNPDVIWIDDDLRYHGHGAPFTAKVTPYADFYCFCEEHLKQFNDKHGTNYDRKTLVDEILAEGKPSWARKAYLDFLRETINDVAKWIEQTIHKENPNIKIAQMTSGPESHAAEGRNWGEFLSNLSGEHSPIIRPTFGPYQEAGALGFISSYSLMSQIKAHVRQTYNKKVYYCPEIENTRFTVWSKSAAATSFQLALSGFLGCENITLSLYDLDGGALFDEPLYGKLLKKQKKLQNKLLSIGLVDAEELGVQIPTTSTSSLTYQCKAGCQYSSLRGEERYIHNYLLKMGIPCKFTLPNEIKNNVLTALDGFSANFLEEQDLKNILSGNVFIEGGAVEKLIEKGLSDYIGINGIKYDYPAVQSEIFHNYYRKDKTFVRVPSRIPVGCMARAELMGECQVLSEFITPTGQRSPGFVKYKNAYGGTVITYLAKGNFGDGFFTHHRVKFIKDLLGEIDLGLPRIDCHSYTLFVGMKKEEIKYYLLTNLSADQTKKYIIDGVSVRPDLKIYQTAVYVKKDGKFRLVGKTKI